MSATTRSTSLSSTSESLFDLARLHCRIIYKLIIYFIRTSNKTGRIGYAKAVMDPFIRFLVLATLLTVLRQKTAPGGMSSALIVASGLLPFMLFRDPLGYLATSAGAGRIFLQHPQVRKTHIIIARFLLKAATILFTSTIIFTIMVLLDMAPMPRDPLGLVMPCLSMLSLGLGAGVLAANTYHISPIIGNINQAIVKVFYLTSGVFFIGRGLPPTIMEWAVLNPTFQGIELFREAFFPILPNPLISIWYPFAWGGALLIIGLCIGSVTEHKVQDDSESEQDDSLI